MLQAMNYERKPFLTQAKVTLRRERGAHTVEFILHIPVVVDKTGHLLLQPVILLHQELIHRTQLPVHGLQATGLLALLLPASINHEKTQFSGRHNYKGKQL